MATPIKFGKKGQGAREANDRRFNIPIYNLQEPSQKVMLVVIVLRLVAARQHELGCQSLAI